MHGRQRSEYKTLQSDPKVIASLTKKAEQWFTLTAQINLENALVLTEKLLTVNPDPLYLWNERRKLCGLEWETEAILTATALKNNPKAYGAWFHRKWCLAQQVIKMDQNHKEDLLKQELTLTVHFLERDERNFHCWNYRRFVVSLLLSLGQETLESSGAWSFCWPLEDPSLGQPTEEMLLMGAQIASIPSTENNNKNGATTSTSTASSTFEENKDWIYHEWEFTKTKIVQNFSNFSAFHYRSKLYPLVFLLQTTAQATCETKSKKEKTLSFLRGELTLVENAIFTEPDDQTAWWYQYFLLQQQQSWQDPSWQDHVLPVWKEHEMKLQELAEEVPNSKWVVLGLFHCNQMLLFLSGKDDQDEDSEKLIHYCHRLLVLDPDRKGRYQSLIRKITKKSK